MQKQKFQLSQKTIAWECSIMFLAIPFLISAFCVGIVALGALESDRVGVMRFAFPIFLGLPALTLAILSVALILLPVGRAIFSYLILSDEGLEYRMWPVQKICCAWDNVEQIKRSSLSFQGDILILKNAHVSGFHILLDINNGNLGVTKATRSIPLYQFEGWPNGKLENALRKHAPTLFVDYPAH